MNWPWWLKHIELRLETISESGELPTVERIEYMLKHSAWVLGHPLVWRVVRRYWSPWHLTDEAVVWRHRLAAALVEGLSEGTHAVTPVKPRRAAPGRAPSLFPKLGEMHGWWGTDEGDADGADAARFRRMYDTVMVKLDSAVNWRRVARQYRRFVDRLEHNTGRAMLTTKVAPAVVAAFDKYMIDEWPNRGVPDVAGVHGSSWEEWGRLRPTRRSFPSWTTAELTDLLVRAFDESRGNPRHYVVCELMTRIPFVRRNGQELPKLTRALVESTMRTIERRSPMRLASRELEQQIRRQARVARKPIYPS